VRRLRRILLLAVPVALAAAPAPAADFLVGRDKGQWLITDGNGFYRVVFHARDQWRKIPTERVGNVQAATATEDGAVVFLAGGNSVRYLYGGHEQYGRTPPGDLWPAGTKALSVCPTGPAGLGLLVLVRRPVAPAPTTAPAATRPAHAGATQLATRPAVVLERRNELALLACGRDQWKQVGIVPPALSGPGGAAFLAAMRARTYVLLARPERRLLELADGAWTKRPLPDALTGGDVLAMFASGDELTLAVFNPDGQGRIRIARFAAGAWSKPFSLRQAVARATPKPITRPAGLPPLLAPFSDGFGVAWRDDGRWVFTRFSRSGVRAAPGEDVLAGAEAQAAAAKLRDRVLIGVMIVLGVLMFWPGRKGRTEPFSLPHGFRPARLAIRFAAFLIDFAPFLALFYVLAGMPESEAVMGDDWKADVMRPRFVQAYFIALGLFAIYGIITEYLLGGTIGKRLLHLRVAGDKGTRPTLREIAIRNVTKIFEITFFYFMWPFPILTQYRQRIGDKAAWTTVIEAPLGPMPERPEPPEERLGGPKGPDRPPEA